MKLFKLSYKVCRKNGNEIYKGFGFHHLSDVTHYYVHPDNQSFKGTTTLCQPIGEAITLLSLLLMGINSENLAEGDGEVGGYYYNDTGDEVFLDIPIPEDWRQNGVVEPETFRYLALLRGESAQLAAYDRNKRWIPGNMEHLHPLYKLLPAFMVIMARELRVNQDYGSLFFKYLENPAADMFVNLHEDLYQLHKLDEYDLDYVDLSGKDTCGLLSFAEFYRTVKDNKKELENIRDITINCFPDSAFGEEYRGLIPQLPEEFILPEGLEGVCNAVTNGDALAVMLHGPSGAGKTMSCKLICKTIGLPVMETVNCTENLDEFVLGKYIPQEDKIFFFESFVTKAIRYGGAVIFEEINFARPQYLAFLNSLLDDNGFVRLDNGELVKRHPNFRFFATMNLGYFGTRELNQALYNRFQNIVELAALPDSAVCRMLSARVPECMEKIDKILGVYHKLQKKIEMEELDVVLSPRNLENWAKLAKYEGYIRAAEKTLVPIAKCDRTLEAAIRSVIMLYRWN